MKTAFIILCVLLYVLPILGIWLIVRSRYKKQKAATKEVVTVPIHASNARKYSCIPLDQLARKIENATGQDHREVLKDLRRVYCDQLVHKYDGVRNGLPHEKADEILAGYIYRFRAMSNINDQKYTSK